MGDCEGVEIGPPDLGCDPFVVWSLSGDWPLGEEGRIDMPLHMFFRRWTKRIEQLINEWLIVPTSTN